MVFAGFKQEGCLGLCPNRFSICLLVGSPLEGQGVLQCGKWRLFAFFGAYGGKETIGALRTLEKILASFYHTLYLWVTAYVSPLSISFDDFLVRFSLSS